MFLWVAMAVPGCIGDPANVPSQWPPADFELLVEEVGTPAEGLRALRSFMVLADGTAVYRLAPEGLAVPGTDIVLPVFRVISSYRMLRETTRILSRELTLEGIAQLGEVGAGRGGDAGAVLRIRYRGFGDDRLVGASGMIHGALVRVLRSINAFLPAGEQFVLPGMTGERAPTLLRGVPPLRDDLAGALAFTEHLAAQYPDIDSLPLDAYALACKQGDRTLALQLLERWERAAGGSKRPPQLLPGRSLAARRAELELFLPP